MNGDDSAVKKPVRKNAIKRFAYQKVYTMEKGPVYSLAFSKQSNDGWRLYAVLEDESTLTIQGANIPRTEVIVEDSEGRRCYQMPISTWTNVRDNVEEKPFNPCIASGNKVIQEEMVEQWGAMRIALNVIRGIEDGDAIQMW
jgi:hypothetical protein